MTIPTATEHPHGLHQRYIIRKANGDPVEPDAVYLVLRLDHKGDDPYWIMACQQAALQLSQIICNGPGVMPQLSKDIAALVHRINNEAMCPCCPDGKCGGLKHEGQE